MIELRPSGIEQGDERTLVNRIIMVDAGVLFESYMNPCRVESVNKKTLNVVPLQRELNEAKTRVIYTDELNRTDNHSTPVQFRTVRMICDTAAEVNAVRTLQDEVEDEHTAFIKNVPGRFRALARRMSQVGSLEG